MVDYKWDAATGRYRLNGRFVPESTVLRELDSYIDSAAQRMMELSRSLQSGSLDLASWQTQMMQEIKLSHINASQLAHGGRAQMSQADYGRVGRIIRTQYDYVRAWGRDIAAGSAPVDGRLIARSALYANAARPTFESIRARDQKNAGAQMEQNVLHASESCAGCRAETAKGLVPVGTLVPIGSRVPCRVNCKCTIRYSKSAEVSNAA